MCYYRDKICVPSSKIKPFLFHASKPTSLSPLWESALVIYNLEPFHFLCNYETADNPAHFIIHEAADVPHSSPRPRFTKLSTQKRHRNRAPLLYARKIITSSGLQKGPPSDGTQGTQGRICFYFAIRTGGEKQEFTLMIRLDPVINTLHGAKGCLHVCVNSNCDMVWR